ncbi:MAG TPA: putative metal-dependent hydrolase, partial [Longimicrobiaceae bacterium]|nr:putative metal-dependent hydrolase [Longimicrobiaceae bacterium]
MNPISYPIGKPKFADSGTTAAERAGWIEDIKSAPSLMRKAVGGLNAEQLGTRYREGGWTLRQVVHHVADSHTNAVMRFRWALAEDEPQIKPYDEAAWAELPDALSSPIEPSLGLLENLHHRWVALLEAMDENAFARAYRHPE